MPRIVLVVDVALMDELSTHARREFRTPLQQARMYFMRGLEESKRMAQQGGETNQQARGNGSTDHDEDSKSYDDFSSRYYEDGTPRPNAAQGHYPPQKRKVQWKELVP